MVTLIRSPHCKADQPYLLSTGLPGGPGGKEPACQCRRPKKCEFNPWVGKIPWRRAWQPIPVFLPGESHAQRSPAGYSPWGHKEPDATEQAGTPFCTVRFERATVFQPSEWKVMLELTSKIIWNCEWQICPFFHFSVCIYIIEFWVLSTEWQALIHIIGPCEHPLQTSQVIINLKWWY